MFPVASGIVAGGSLMGVAIAAADNGPELVRTIWNQIFGGAGP